jgi:hypothetical protein
MTYNTGLALSSHVPCLHLNAVGNGFRGATITRSSGLPKLALLLWNLKLSIIYLRLKVLGVLAVYRATYRNTRPQNLLHCAG